MTGKNADASEYNPEKEAEILLGKDSTALMKMSALCLAMARRPGTDGEKSVLLLLEATTLSSMALTKKMDILSLKHP